MEIRIDLDRLRRALTDHFQAALIAGLPLAMIELMTVSDCAPDDLVRIAIENGFDLRDFELK